MQYKAMISEVTYINQECLQCVWQRPRLYDIESMYLTYQVLKTSLRSLLKIGGKLEKFDVKFRTIVFIQLPF